MPSVAIVGAGIAGLALAWRLTRAGFAVSIYERGASVLSGASSVAAALLHAPLAAEHDLDGQLARASLSASMRALGELAGRGVDPGLVSGAIRERRQRRGVDCLHRDGGWLAPEVLANALLKDAGPALRVRTLCEVRQISVLAAAWQLALASGEQTQHDALVLCCAGAAAQLLPTLTPLLQPVSGQAERLSGRLPPLEHAWAGDLSVIPVSPDSWLVGASYLRGVQHSRSESVTSELLAQVSALFAPEQLAITARSSWFGTRWVSPDRRALVGFATQADSFLRDGWPTPVPGLWLNLAHGSRGFTSAFLAAELLCGMLSGKDFPLPERLRKALDPRRFSRR